MVPSCDLRMRRLYANNLAMYALVSKVLCISACAMCLLCATRMCNMPQIIWQVIPSPLRTTAYSMDVCIAGVLSVASTPLARPVLLVISNKSGG